nr:MAG TPA: hypothetical protein [Bacteriophage sp.]
MPNLVSTIVLTSSYFFNFSISFCVSVNITSSKAISFSSIFKNSLGRIKP